VDIGFTNTIFDNRFCIVFARLSDDTFEKVKEQPKLLNDEVFLTHCLGEAGPNIHMIKGYGDARGLKPLTKELIKQNPKTISFYRDDLERLHYLYGRES
jgi:hypothetical protein